jgi:hypothetical protein
MVVALRELPRQSVRAPPAAAVIQRERAVGWVAARDGSGLTGLVSSFHAWTTPAASGRWVVRLVRFGSSCDGRRPVDFVMVGDKVQVRIREGLTKFFLPIRFDELT